MPAIDIGSHNDEAFEIQRQARALVDQTNYYNTSCSNICDYLDQLASLLQGTLLENTIKVFSDDYRIIESSLSNKYMDLADTMNTWASATISNYDKYIQRYKNNISKMLDLLQRMGAER